MAHGKSNRHCLTRKVCESQTTWVYFYSVYSLFFYLCLSHSQFISTYLTFMWFLPRVDKVVFLEVRQLREALFTQVTLERSLATVHSEMDLQLQMK